MASTDPRPLAPLPDDPKPTSAKQAVEMVREDAKWVASKPDLNSTDGIKRNIEALWAAIGRLAAYIDGDSPKATKPASPVYQAPQPNA